MLRWTAGHCGIEGNEIADREAKAAVQGHTSDKKLLPSLLRHKLTNHSTALKQHHDAIIKEKWKVEWRSSMQGRKMAELDNTTPSLKFIDSISSSKLTRHGSSLLSQLRIGHFPLNSYLHKMKRVDSPRCPACGAANETIHHFLITCPSYAHERWSLLQRTHGALTVKDLLTDEKRMKPLMFYIKETG